jgi:GTPase SAR1 family protein
MSQSNEILHFKILIIGESSVGKVRLKYNLIN